MTLPALLAVAFLLVPLGGILVRTRWSELGAHLSAPGVTEALRLSLLVSGWALGLSLLLGVPLAWVLARVDFPGKALVRALVLLPMVLPPTVGGVALLLGFGRRGLLGPWLEETFGLVLPFHTSGAVVAATFVAMPFLVISLEGALAGLRPGYEETAASLGASPLRVFATVTVPMVAPGLAAGAALTWARALGEFGATITFAGNLPGTTQTLPLQVYLLLQDSPEAATSLSLLLLAVAMAVLVALRGRWTGGAPPRAGRRRARRRHDVPDEPSDTYPDEPSDEGPGAGAGRSRGLDSAHRGHETTEATGATGATGDTHTGGGREPGERPVGRAAVEATGGGTLTAELSGFVRLALGAEPGTTIAVVGPNGAGKTTLLRALLGLTPRARARLLLGGRDVSRLPVHRRRVSWVPQDGALFPHLSARANVAYGLRAHGVRRSSARRTATHWLDQLGVGHLAHRRPAQLSGGQAQRVALARALASDPRLLLLDEPLAALDQTTRTRVRRTLRRHLDGFTGVCLLVTHDPVEAVSLADRVLVLEAGAAVQYGTPSEVVRRPGSRWVARMLGNNAWPGTVTAHGGLALDEGGELATDGVPADAVLPHSPTPHSPTPTPIRAPAPAPVPAPDPAPEGALRVGGRALAVVAPDAVSVFRRRPDGSPRNVWPGTVREITALGGRLRVVIVPESGPELIAEITSTAAAELRLAEGTHVWAVLKATQVTLIPT
ncbi:molybdate ABC transporter permease subunit [Streptomyces sp. AJS327]|uniref:ABC transporter permease n=1 Tax=Streptomyces sp. AJS327 TaxID=2545265 RepID=UPI0015DE1AF9|nr:ABC transporter permease [Streptomyces sp. AJS327]MBA0052674.1 molybdate ABC transporter permease subunit [Streptomyces sp. AJS327]